MSDEAELRERLGRPYGAWDERQLRNQREYWRSRQIVAQREIETTMRELDIIDAEVELRGSGQL